MMIRVIKQISKSILKITPLRRKKLRQLEIKDKVKVFIVPRRMTILTYLIPYVLIWWHRLTFKNSPVFKKWQEWKEEDQEDQVALAALVDQAWVVLKVLGIVLQDKN